MSLCAAMNHLVVPLSRAAAAFVAAGGWSIFGFARLDDYSRERLDRSGRWLRDLAALARLFEDHPPLVGAVTGEDGGRPIGQVAALLIGRGVPPDHLDRWIAIARKSSVRELRRLIREGAACPGPAGSEESNSKAERALSHGDDRSVPACSGAGDDSVVGQTGDRSLARFQVPRAIRIAFDEVLDLFRCVEGKESSVTSFVEALVAEGIGPDVPADVDEVPLGRTRGRALDEELLARSTDHWRHLPARPAAREATFRAVTDLLAFESLDRCSGKGDAAALDRQLRHLICLQERLSVRLGLLLMTMGDRGAWVRLRFTGPGHYAEERLRIGRTRAEDRIRVARALRRFPVLRKAYERGLIKFEATLEIIRLLSDRSIDRETEEAWVHHAEATTVKRLRDESRALGRRIVLNRQVVEPHHPVDGDTSSEPDRPGGAQPDSVPLDTCPRPLPLSDAEWQQSISRAIGTARDRVLELGLLAAGARRSATTPSPHAESGSAIAVDSLSIAMQPGAVASSALPACPDVFLRLRLPAELCISFLATVEAARRRLAHEAGDDPWTESVDGGVARPSWIAARTFSIRSRRIPSWVGLLALLEEFVDVWDRQHRPARPARDAVFIREGWRCAAPGCTSRRHLEDHHVIYRSKLGNNMLSNRICICRFHHQLGEHGDLAACHGIAPLAITWRLGRAGVGGRYRNERRLDVAA